MSASEVTTGVDSLGNVVEIGHELPKASIKGEETFSTASIVEATTEVEILDGNGNKKGDKVIKENKDMKDKESKQEEKEAKKEEKNLHKHSDDSEELFGIFDWFRNGDDSGSGGGTTPPTEPTGNRVVTVLIAVDEEYRAARPDWQTFTQNIVERADDAFIRDHGIDFEIKAVAEWSSQGNNASEILQDLDRDWNGRGYDFVVGFTRDAKFNSGGIAYVYPYAPNGSAISVNLDQGAENTWHAAQHEFSHNYGLGHDPQGSGIRCIMNYDYSYSVDYWDQEHDDVIQQHKTWFGQ
ncbi:peptidase M84 [Mangrovibacillus cuniculi]|uniref:Peptidase M84 n=2 Tax=Mangrovibacillus cuniculi TaxID=2593652 RepID=A0A7S8HHA6_9BACI|nr:peptidase M84 [Mangrovibacillus cuniculi]